MRNNLYVIGNIIILIFPLFLLFSCEKELEIQLKEAKPRLVVNCLFTENENFLLTVEKSCFIFDTTYTFINNAKVKLFENDIFIENLTNIDSGRYISNICKPTPNNYYSITVDYDGIESVIAKSYLPSKFTDFDMEIIRNFHIDNNTTYHFLKLKIRDNSDIENYYFFEGIMDSIYTEILNQNAEFEWVWLNVMTLFKSENKILKDENLSLTNDWGTNKLILSDYFFINKEIELDLTFYSSSTLESDYKDFKLYFYNISKEYYLYLKKIDLIDKNLNVSPYFIKDPIQMYTNVENGFGIFAGYNCYVDSI